MKNSTQMNQVSTSNISSEHWKHVPSFGICLTEGKLEDAMEKEGMREAVCAYFEKMQTLRGSNRARGNVALLVFEKHAWGSFPPKYGVASYIPELNQVTYHIPECLGGITGEQ